MIPRHIEPHLLRLAAQYPVITLTGPRQSGKTTVCQKVFADYAYVNLEDIENRRYATEDPRGFLGQFPGGVVLDEIQRTPDLPSYIQGIVDRTQKPGQFILTGSQQFEVTQSINQSLAGRTAVLRLLPFSFSELYHKKPSPALETLLYTGFYPRIYDKHLNPSEALSFYLTTYVERDIRSLIHVRDLSTFERFLKICASQTGQLLNYSTIANDCGVNQNTVKSWLSLLEASYIIFRLQPHHKHFRKRLTKSPKLFFYDVGLAAYLLGIRRPAELDAHPIKGHLFENFVITELLKGRYNTVQDNNLYFFRDHVGNEVDLIVEQGLDLISIEIKAGKTIASDQLKGLLYYQKLSGAQNTARYLIYAGDQAQTRSDVTIVPYTHIDTLFTALEAGE